MNNYFYEHIYFLIGESIGATPPQDKQAFTELIGNFEKVILPSLINWKHRKHFGFLPAGNSIPNIFGDMLSTSIGGVGFSWVSINEMVFFFFPVSFKVFVFCFVKFQTSQPALTELENLMLDWFADLLRLPSAFSFKGSMAKGGGSIQNSGTDAIFNTMIAARFYALIAKGAFGGSTTFRLIKISANYFGQTDEEGRRIEHPGTKVAGLCCLASYEAHSSFRKAAKLALLDYVLVPAPKYKLTRINLRNAHKIEVDKGKTPIYTLLSIGTPNSCAADDIQACAKFCNENGMWCHVNASYAGNAFLLNDLGSFERLRTGLDYVDSINISPYKMLLCAPDLALLWVKNTFKYTRPFLLEAEYLLNVHAGSEDLGVQANSIDYRNYGVPLTRRMRALKIFFVLQTYTVHYLRNLIENQFYMMKTLRKNISSDVRFEDLCGTDSMGMVVFRQKVAFGSRDEHDLYNLNLLARLQLKNEILVTPCHMQQSLAIHFSINDEFATFADIGKYMKSCSLNTNLVQYITIFRNGLGTHPKELCRDSRRM